jgi:glutamate synthase domain-containing protein 2
MQITLNKKIKIDDEEKSMNIKTTIATLSILSALSFGAVAAESIDASQAQNLQAVGTISVSGVAGSPMDIKQKLSDKADQQGAKAYRVIEAYNNGNYHATAALYN